MDTHIPSLSPFFGHKHIQFQFRLSTFTLLIPCIMLTFTQTLHCIPLYYPGKHLLLPQRCDLLLTILAL